MNREQLRTFILAEARKLQNSVARRFMTENERKLSYSASTFWSQDNPTTNAALDALATIFNAT